MLTRVQQETVGVIAELTEMFGRPPTFGEVGAELDLNRGNVFQIAARLRERGWLATKGKLVLTQTARLLPEPEVEITEAGRQALTEARAV